MKDEFLKARGIAFCVLLAGLFVGLAWVGLARTISGKAPTYEYGCEITDTGDYVTFYPKGDYRYGVRVKMSQPDGDRLCQWLNRK